MYAVVFSIISQHPTPPHPTLPYFMFLLAVPCYACRAVPSLSHTHTTPLHTIPVTPSHSYSLLLHLTFANLPPLSHTSTHSYQSLYSQTRTFSLNLFLSPSKLSFLLTYSYSLSLSLSLHFALRASTTLSVTSIQNHQFRRSRM